MTSSRPQRAAIYARISEDRDGTSRSVQRQLDDCREFAQARGIRVITELSDRDRSAYSKRRREGFEQVLDLIRDDQIDGILAWRLDRLYRRMIELESLIDIAEHRAGHLFLWLVDGQDLDLGSSSGRLVARTLTTAASQEVEIKSERTIRAFRELAEEGSWKGGRRPYGYERDGVAIRQIEADALREAATRLLAGESVLSTAKWFTEAVKPFPEEDHESRHKPGFVVSATGLRDALISERIVGKRAYRPLRSAPTGKSKSSARPLFIKDAAWDAILDESTWLRLRALFESRALQRPRRARVAPLADTLFCGRCGTSLGFNSPNYSCPAGRGCGRLSVSSRRVEEIVLGSVDSMISNNRETIVRGAAKATLGIPTEVLTKLKEFDRRIAEIQEAADAEAITLRTAMRMRQELDAERAAIGAIGNSDDQRRASLTLLTHNMENWRDQEPDYQRKIVHALVRHVIVQPTEQRGQRFDVNRVEMHWMDSSCGCVETYRPHKVTKSPNQ